MTDQFVPFGSQAYWLMLALLCFARGMDFLSTWIATPGLLLEANPLARKLGWRGGLLLNAVICVVFATWPLPAIVLMTTSLLVAARNFQVAWLMRSLGEAGYAGLISEQMRRTSLRLYLFCLAAQCVLVGMVGAAVMWFSGGLLVPLAIGLGIVAYGMALLLFPLFSLWRARRWAD